MWVGDVELVTAGKGSSLTGSVSLAIWFSEKWIIVSLLLLVGCSCCGLSSIYLNWTIWRFHICPPATCTQYNKGPVLSMIVPGIHLSPAHTFLTIILWLMKSSLPALYILVMIEFLLDLFWCTNIWSHDIISGSQFSLQKQCARSNICGALWGLFSKLTGMPLIVDENILVSVFALFSWMLARNIQQHHLMMNSVGNNECAWPHYF